MGNAAQQGVSVGTGAGGHGTDVMVFYEVSTDASTVRQRCGRPTAGATGVRESLVGPRPVLDRPAHASPLVQPLAALYAHGIAVRLPSGAVLRRTSQGPVSPIGRLVSPCLQRISPIR